MTIPDGQIWTLHHTGHAYYWTRWRDAPLIGDKVDVMGRGLLVRLGLIGGRRVCDG